MDFLHKKQIYTTHNWGVVVATPRRSTRKIRVQAGAKNGKLSVSVSQKGQHLIFTIGGNGSLTATFSRDKTKYSLRTGYGYISFDKPFCKNHQYVKGYNGAFCDICGVKSPISQDKIKAQDFDGAVIDGGIYQDCIFTKCTIKYGTFIGCTFRNCKKGWDDTAAPIFNDCDDVYTIV